MDVLRRAIEPHTCEQASSRIFPLDGGGSKRLPSNSQSGVLLEISGHTEFVRTLLWQLPAPGGVVVVADSAAKQTLALRQYVYEAITFGVPKILVIFSVHEKEEFDSQELAAVKENIIQMAADLQFDGLYVADPLLGEKDTDIKKTLQALVLEDLPGFADDGSATICGSENISGLRMVVLNAEQDTGEIEAVIVCGQIDEGHLVTVEPDGARTSVSRIDMESELDGDTHTGATVRLQLTDDIEVSSGDIIRHSDVPMETTDQIQAHVLWVADAEMIPGRQYTVRLASREAMAWVTDLKYKLDFRSLEHLAGKTLSRNEVAVCNLSFDRRMPCEAFKACGITGALELLDRESKELVGLGKMDFALRRTKNLTRQKLKIDRSQRAKAIKAICSGGLVDRPVWCRKVNAGKRGRKPVA